MAKVIYEVMVRCDLVQPEDRAGEWQGDELKEALTEALNAWAERVSGEVQDLDIVIE